MPSKTQPTETAQALLEHQVGDVAFIQRERRVLLGNEPGTGKSRSALEATQGMRTLVVAPGMVITSGTWADETARWADDPGRITVAPYSMLNARAGSRVLQRLRPEYAGHWDAVIVDEAHYTKGRKTSWTWAVEQIARDADVVVEMTGTPIPNWAHELYTILRVVHAGEARPGGDFGSFWRWAARWFNTSPTRFSNGNPVVGELLGCDRACLLLPPHRPCDHYAEFMAENLGSKYRRVLRDDVLDLPPLTKQKVEVPLSTAQRRIYTELKREFSSTVKGEEVLAWSQGALNVMLDKVTTSPWLLTKEGKPHGGKLDRLAFDLTARSRPTLVFAHYRDSVDACAAVAREIGARVAVVHGGTSQAQDADAFRAFKTGKVDVLCASLEKVAEGAQLQQADMAIFVETSFKPHRNEQALYRIHRLGQTRPCVALDYVTPRTVDQRKRKLLAVKTDRQMRFLSAAEYKALL